MTTKHSFLFDVDAANKVVAATIDGQVWPPPTVTPPPAPTTVNSAARIQQSMVGPHEGFPHGVPTGWSWAQGPQVQAATPPAGMTAMVPWGQVYSDTADTHPPDSRVAFRSISAYALLKSTNVWVPLLVSSNFDGAHYNEDFSGNGSVGWNARVEPDGSTSVDMVSRFNAHFYPRARATLGSTPSNIAGIFTTVQARIIEATPGGVNDTAQAKWILNMGADWWRDLSAPFVGDFSNNPGVGQGKFQYLTPSWQAFNFYSVTPAQIAANLPPFT